jgi:alpha-mannosidase
MLDTLLVGRGEERRRFRFGIVLDSAHPAQDALAFRSPLATVENAAKPASGEVGRLFLVDAKNVVATHWESLFDGPQVVGFRVRLLETEGRSGRVELHAPRKLTSARQVDFRGKTLVDAPPNGDRIAFDVAAYEWLEIEARY